MRRSPDLEREILLRIEASESSPLAWIELNDIEEYSSDAVAYHVRLLDEAGLIEAEDLSTISSFEWKPKRLTMRGHQYLDDIRSPEIWSKAKAGAEKVGSFSIETLTALAKGFIKKKIQDHTGIEVDL